MTNKNREDVLKKAIEKAVKNGYILWDSFPDKSFTICSKRAGGYELRGEWGNGDTDYTGMEPKFWLDHEFAKAFFGEGKDLRLRILHEGGDDYLQSFIPAWQYHLQQLVLEPDPLEYIEKYL